MAVPRKSKLLMLAALCLAVAGWSGYRAERRAMNAAGAPKTNVRTIVKRLVTPKAKRAGVDRLEELRQAIGRKFPSRQETAALWAVVRGFSVEEVKAALEALPKESGRRVNGEIANMLVYRWAQLEPEAAAAATLATGDRSRQFDLYTILIVWAQRDPDAAIRWGRESGYDIAQHAAQQLAAGRWLAEGPATAISRARTEFPDTVPNVIRGLVAKLAGTPESRRQLFSVLAKEMTDKDDPWLFQRLAWDLGRPDPAGVEEIAGEMAAAGLQEERIRQFREGAGRHQATNNSREVLENPPTSNPAAAEHIRHGTYAVWSMNEPDKALQWAEARGETDLVSRAVGSFAEKLLESDWSPGRRMNPPWADTVRRQFPVWQRLDAPAADAWLASMPADIRKLLATPTPESDVAR